MSDDTELSLPDGWAALRALTPARLALGRAGVSQPSRAVLDFALAHSQARDAIETPLDVDRLRADLAPLGVPIVAVASRAKDRAQYLVRPDLGRRLDPRSAAMLNAEGAPDLVFVLGDGLSSLALQSHAAPLLAALWPRTERLAKAPIVIATQARVALADEVGALLGARLAISIIGERPGLSAPDSLGVYVTYGPRVGTTDEARNCISNIRPGGLTYDEAAGELAAIIAAALGARCSGIALQAAAGALPDRSS